MKKYLIEAMEAMEEMCKDSKLMDGIAEAQENIYQDYFYAGYQKGYEAGRKDAIDEVLEEIK